MQKLTNEETEALCNFAYDLFVGDTAFSIDLDDEDWHRLVRDRTITKSNSYGQRVRIIYTGLREVSYN
ncbi:MAG: hypothetical protein LUE29_09670 [Lachnospiraceae bacterium]|nr:hypothetical protein [Lachnospiraceae bacterium]